MLDHCLKVDVNLDTLQLVVRLTLTLQLTNLLHLKSSCISIDFDLIDFICCSHFSGLQVATLSSHKGCIRHVQVGHSALRNTGLSLGLDAELLLESIFPFLRRSVGGQALVFQLIQHSFWCHLINLMLLLKIFEFCSFHGSF